MLDYRYYNPHLGEGVSMIINEGYQWGIIDATIHKGEGRDIYIYQVATFTIFNKKYYDYAKELGLY